MADDGAGPSRSGASGAVAPEGARPPDAQFTEGFGTRDLILARRALVAGPYKTPLKLQARSWPGGVYLTLTEPK